MNDRFKTQKGDLMVGPCSAVRGMTEHRRRRYGQLTGLLVVTLALLLAMTGSALALDQEGCLICHGDPNFTNPNPREGYPTSLHVDSAAFAKSVHSKNKCSSCHKGFTLSMPQHQTDPSKDYKAVAIEACEGCHKKEFMAYQTSAHAKMYFGSDTGPICISCHGSHEIKKVQLGSETAEFKMSMARDSCGRCHQDKFEKAMHEFHFKALSLGYARAATCFDCHGAHQNLALKSGEEETVKQCRQCHPGATKGFTYFQMHLEENFSNAWWGVQIVYRFFSTLLLVVLVTGIAYTTIHFQKEIRIMLGVAGRGLGRLFGFIRALEEESAREKVDDEPNGHDSAPGRDDRGDR